MYATFVTNKTIEQEIISQCMIKAQSLSMKNNTLAVPMKSSTPFKGKTSTIKANKSRLNVFRVKKLKKVIQCMYECLITVSTLLLFWRISTSIQVLVLTDGGCSTKIILKALVHEFKKHSIIQYSKISVFSPYNGKM